jgi:pectate lyase
MFNNYHLNNSGYSLGARAGGTVRTDNEYFSGCKKPISTSLAGDPPGYFSGVNTNIYLNCGSNTITTTISSWVPSYSYNNALDAAADVPNLVTQGTGPRAIH